MNRNDDPEEFKSFLKGKEEIFKEKRERFESLFLKKQWKDEGLPNPFKIVREFIIEKGLKLYGGLALHEHLNKFDAGIYEDYKFPDYDVFSPDAWHHAKELADKLYSIGFHFTEAKASILNDEHHQTYKVGVDMLYILDLTQVGCTSKQLKLKDCDKCGINKEGECISIFNKIPSLDLLTYNPKEKGFKERIIYESYDYDNNKSIFKNKLLITSPLWLKISMYRELTEPFSDPDRLVKVATRLNTFITHFKHDHGTCNPKDYKQEVEETLIPVLNYIAEYIKKYKLINYGASTYNLLVKNYKPKKDNLGALNVSDYQVYSKNGEYHVAKLLKQLKAKFPKFKFNTQEKIMYWKEIDTDSFTIHVSNNNKANPIQYKDIITFSNYDMCIPYMTYDGVRYVTVDRMKYILYRATALKDVMAITEENPKNYECMLSFLLRAEKNYRRKHKKLDSGKFRRFTDTCDMDKEFSLIVSKIVINLTNLWSEKIETLKNTDFILDYPKPGYITKISPLPSEDLKLPYRPFESKYKKFKKPVKTLLGTTKFIKTKKKSEYKPVSVLTKRKNNYSSKRGIFNFV